MKIDEKVFNLCYYKNKALISLIPTMSPCGNIPKSVAQSQLKMCLYESFENHWHTMVWLAEGSRGNADIWWDDTIEWLEHVSLEHVSIEKINPVVSVPIPEHERRTSTVAWPKPSDRY